MSVFLNFLFAFVFSFIGSIPPGTINITVLQLGIERKIKVAWRLAITASVMEYPYAWLAVKFESLITSSPVIVDNFKLIGSLVMLILGVFNLWSAKKPTSFAIKFQNSGFRRGMILSILNPMAMPFWIGVTAYLKIQGWIELTGVSQLQSYLAGIVLGTLALLLAAAYLAKKVATVYQPGSRIKFIPGVVLFVLGLYGFINYLFF